MLTGGYLRVCLLTSAVLLPLRGMAATLTTLYSFGPQPDAGAPLGDVLIVDGQIYGASLDGGHGCEPYGCGTVFTLDPSTGAERVLHAFSGGRNNYAGGFEPIGGLTYAHGSLFGSTTRGGAADTYSDGGTVFKMNPSSGHEKVLEPFAGAGYPFGQLLAYQSKLIGTTYYGGDGAGCGTYGCGTIYQIDLTTGAYTVLHSFQGGSDGAGPAVTLLRIGHHLYGTTTAGGTHQRKQGGDGTMFMLDTQSGVFHHLFDFDYATTGASPRGDMAASGSMLYGITEEGGPSGNCNGGCGTVYGFDLNTRTATLLHAFSQTGGNAPEGGVVLFNGQLYGTTPFSESWGTIFAVNPTNSAFQLVYVFTGAADGCTPYAGLVAYNGAMYGATSGCGASGRGTIFELTP